MTMILFLQFENFCLFQITGGDDDLPPPPPGGNPEPRVIVATERMESQTN